MPDCTTIGSDAVVEFAERGVDLPAGPFCGVPMIRVSSVHPDSLAAELGLREGTELLSVNGRELQDFLDWEFLTADEELLLHVRQPDGEEIEFDIERPLGEPMGVTLEPPRIRRCANRCDFCFVDGLPEGLRDVLYIRDDDYRLSFRYGNFATLTNLKPRDIERIIEYRLSPLYVSVHATDPTIRRFILRNPDAPDIIPQLQHFARHGIQFHTQIVMAPGVNDGPVLRQTLATLYDFGAAILSCSVVPVGLTEFSKHHLVREPTRDECRSAVTLVEERAAIARRDRGISWAFGADELYLRAGLDLPLGDVYDGFDQVENGVGSVRWLQQRIHMGEAVLADWAGKRIGVVTGTAMAQLMPMVLQPLSQMTGSSFELIPVVNTLFGASVTTAGLLPGAAVQRALQDHTSLDLALLPGEAVNDDALFIDGLPLQSVQASVPLEVRTSRDFVDALQEPASI
jgi:putative radical SAM enzyme (TIGR03279 family)